MKTVCICGHLADGTGMNDGQTVKTRMLRDELKRQLGATEVYCIDTHGRMKQIQMFPRLVLGLICCRNVIMLPAQNGLPLVSGWLYFWNKLYRRRIHYSVIGGWLASFLDNNPRTKKHLTCFDKIYAETSTMKRALESRGLSNVVVIPNCKSLPIVLEEQIDKQFAMPHRLVTFSRVMKQKGIEDLINVIISINNTNDKTVYHLDIYGPVAPGEHDWWKEQMARIEQTDYIQYKGSVPADKSVEILCNYFALVFPTKFYTEGIPGTIIDAYAAGLPVISAKWESFDDLIEDGVTGLGFGFEDWDELKALLLRVSEEPSIIIDMKKACIKKAEGYLPINVIPLIVNEL